MAIRHYTRWPVETAEKSAVSGLTEPHGPQAGNPFFDGRMGTEQAHETATGEGADDEHILGGRVGLHGDLLIAVS
jgi:hypothetical protein